jgi:cellulose synthase/poly-beta-1,6-N-acetylglucosamine synthase-like glycosyltransferase
MSGLLEAVVAALVLVSFVGPFVARMMMRRRPDDKLALDFEPTVTVVTPMFNEGARIRQTIASILAQDYPAEKLSVIVVDDCSTDDSYEQALDATSNRPRVSVLRNDTNMGKRCSINRAVRTSTAEIIVSVDSDVVLEHDAVRHLIRRFTSPRIAAVGGRVDILNKRQNWLTRMQAVIYYYGYQFLKTIERSYRSVMCLSGCLTAYRRSVLLELEPVLDDRNILGVPIKYGEDRFLTRQIVKAGYQTTMTTDAVCRTDVPHDIQDYLSQQLRWRRSNIVDYVGGLSHVWRVHAVVAIQYYALFALFLAYPALLVQSLLDGTFWHLMTAHVAVAGGMGLLYRVHARHYPAEQRVSPLAALPFAIILPVSYALLTVQALLTLDSGKWETRGHVVPEPVTAAAPQPAAAPVPTLVPAEIRVAQPQSRAAVVMRQVEALDSAVRANRRTRRSAARVKAAAVEEVAARLNRAV